MNKLHARRKDPLPSEASVLAALAVLILTVLSGGAASAQPTVRIGCTGFGLLTEFDEEAFSLLIGIERVDLRAPATFTFSTLDGTARAGQDYQAVAGQGTLEVPGDPCFQVLVPIFEDTLPEGDETFTFGIEPLGVTRVSGPRSVEVTIRDDDGEPEVSFDVPRGRTDNGELTWVVSTRKEDDPEEPTTDCLLGGIRVPRLRLSQAPSERAEVIVGVVDGPVERTFRVELFTGTTTTFPDFSARVPCSELPVTLEILEVTDSEFAIGEPSRVRIEPCLVEVLDSGRVPCAGCVYEIFDAARCVAIPNVCFDSLGAPHRVASAASFSGALGGVELLTALRDGPMSETPAGRYYRDLYDIFSPKLAETMLADPFVFYDLLDAQEPWLEALATVVENRPEDGPITNEMVDSMLDIMDRVEAAGDDRLRSLFRFERERLDFPSLAGATMADFVERVESRGGPPPCADTDTALCLQGGRFLVEVFWKDFEGRSGVGRATPLSSDSGTFWFFSPDNVELVVKVLDGRVLNDRFWVFYGALTNVEFSLRVTDTETGAVRSYENLAGTFASAGDTNAFDAEGSRRSALVIGRGDEPRSLSRQVAASVGSLARRAWRAIENRVAAGSRKSLQRALRAARSGDGRSVACTPSELALCLNGGRFRVEVEWRDFVGKTGRGTAHLLTGDTGSFWFFDPANTELLIKVLDAREINGNFWVFYGALSNVEFTITVTDTETGRTKRYVNPLGDFASVGDTEGLPGG